ncbi:MAG: GAF domain-containing protein [Akkermansiaceae bacterium]
MTDPNRPLEKYDHFSLPSVLDLKADLTDILGYARAEPIWAELSEACSITSEDFLTVDELRSIADWCVDSAPAVKAFGFSLKLKVDTFLALEKDNAYNPDRQNIRQLLHDEKRLETIAKLGLSDTEKDPFLMGIVEEASKKLDLPISVVSILFNSMQYFAAHHGLDSGWIADACATDVEWSFCQYVLDSNKVLEVQDAKNVSYLKNSPLVTNDSIVCYLGAPLTLKNGVTVGTLCVIGHEPRSFDATDKVQLLELASRITDYLNDKLTKVTEEKAEDGE